MGILNKIGSLFRLESGSRSRKHAITNRFGVNIAPNEEIGFTFNDVVARARFAADNNELADNGLTLLCDYAVGSKINFNFKKMKGTKPDIELFKSIFDEVRGTTELDFYDGFTFDEFIWNCLYLCNKDGDLFIRKRVDVRKPFGITFQPIEIDHLARDMVFKKFDNGGYIDKGFEYDSQGRVIAYHLYKAHPNGVNWSKNRDIIRVPKSQIFHFKNSLKNRAGQTRGLSVLRGIVTRLGNLQKYDRTQISKQGLAGTFGMILKKTGLAGMFGDGINFTQSSSSDDGPMLTEHKNKIKSMADGSVLEVSSGHEVHFPNQPKSEEYESFTNINSRFVSVGMQIPEPILTNNYKDVNFSSLRGAVLPFHRRIEIVRNGRIRVLLNYIFREIVKTFNVKYDKGISGYPEARYQAKDMLDPVKETQAIEKKLRMGMDSLQNVCNSYTDDGYEKIQEQREEDRKNKKEKGLLNAGDLEDDLGRNKHAKKQEGNTKEN